MQPPRGLTALAIVCFVCCVPAHASPPTWLPATTQPRVMDVTSGQRVIISSTNATGLFLRLPVTHPVAPLRLFTTVTVDVISTANYIETLAAVAVNQPATMSTQPCSGFAGGPGFSIFCAQPTCKIGTTGKAVFVNVSASTGPGATPLWTYAVTIHAVVTTPRTVQVNAALTLDPSAFVRVGTGAWAQFFAVKLPAYAQPQPLYFAALQNGANQGYAHGNTAVSATAVPWAWDGMTYDTSLCTLYPCNHMEDPRPTVLVPSAIAATSGTWYATAVVKVANNSDPLPSLVNWAFTVETQAPTDSAKALPGVGPVSLTVPAPAVSTTKLLPYSRLLMPEVSPTMSYVITFNMPNRTSPPYRNGFCQVILSCSDAPARPWPPASCSQFGTATSQSLNCIGTQQTLVYPTRHPSFDQAMGGRTCDVRATSMCGAEPVTMSVQVAPVPAPFEFGTGGSALYKVVRFTRSAPAVVLRYKPPSYNSPAAVTTITPPNMCQYPRCLLNSRLCWLNYVYNATTSRVASGGTCALMYRTLFTQGANVDAEGMSTVLLYSQAQWGKWTNPLVNITAPPA